jgi:hypothetical protein
MGWNGISHPEWGYLAPGGSKWKMRLFIFAAAIVASATGAACCSFVYRPVLAEASVAERTLIPDDQTALAEKASETSQVNVPIATCSPVDPGNIDDPEVPAPLGGVLHTLGRPDCPIRAGVDGQLPASAAGNLRTATAMSANNASRNVRTSAPSSASTAPAARIWKPPSKGARVGVRAAPRYGSYAAAGYQPWYSANRAGAYGPPSRYGAYGDQQYR